MINFLKVMTNNDIEEVGLENILNAKLTQLVGSKGVTFKQYSHSKPMALGYQAFCFIPSGAGKDEIIRHIDTTLMPFLKDKLDNVIEQYKTDLRDELYHKASLLDGKEKKAAEMAADELISKIRCCNINISDATFTGIFYEAEQISKTGYGALCIKLTEFGDNVDAAISGDSNAKELLAKLKDISDGAIEPKVIAGEVRKNIYNIPVISIMCCDYTSLLKGKHNEYLMNYLSSGMARRAFTYIPKEQKNINTPTSWKEREQAQARAIEISKWLEEMYDSIPNNMVCEFSAGAKSLLNEFEMECISEFNKLFKIDEIRAKEVKGSFWKITKLAVVKSIIDNPTCSLVDSVYVQQAIDFYRKIQPCLDVLISKRPDSPEELLKKFLTKQKDGAIITRTQIKNLNLHKGNFKDWCDDALDEIKRELGFVYDWKGSGRATGVQIRKGK